MDKTFRLITILLACFPAIAFGQEIPERIESTSIHGVVHTEQSRPVVGARITVMHLETNYGDFSVSNEEGRFEFNNLPFGKYVARIERIGFEPRDIESLVAGNEYPITITLARGAGFNPSSEPKLTPDNYATVSVFYGTDRSKNKDGSYGTRRGKLEFGTTDVSVPRDHRHQTGHLESPSIWRLQFRPNPEKHVTVLRIDSKAQSRFRDDLHAAIDGTDSKSAFVFVHGFKITFEDAARQTAQIAYDLGFDGAPIMYSWPSNGKLSLADYISDGEDNAWSIPNLQTFLSVLIDDSGADTVHLIAHSMGNRLLTSALAGISQTTQESDVPQFAQIALVAPDIDAEIFTRDIAPKIMPTGGRLTLYASSNDKALGVAKLLRDGYPRAGDLSDGIVVVRGLDTIDVSALDTGFGGHSYYADSESVIADLFYLIHHGTPPSQRYRLRSRMHNEHQYWQFAP